VPFQFDYGHVTRQGSILVAERLVKSGAFNVLQTSSAISQAAGGR